LKYFIAIWQVTELQVGWGVDSFCVCVCVYRDFGSPTILKTKHYAKIYTVKVAQKGF